MTARTRPPATGDLPDGLAAPALRALASAGIQNLKQLARFSEAEVARLHGIGPNALKVLKSALKASGLSFAVAARREAAAPRRN